MNRKWVAVVWVGFVGACASQVAAQHSAGPTLQASEMGSVFAGELAGQSYFGDACPAPCIPVCSDPCYEPIALNAVMTPSVVVMPACSCQQVMYLAQTTTDGKSLPVYSGSSFATSPMQTCQVVPMSNYFVPQFRTAPPVTGYSQPGRFFPARRGTWFPLRSRRVR